MITTLLLTLAVSIPIEVHYLPAGVKTELPSGEVVMGFNLEEYKLLLKLDADLWGKTQAAILSDKLLLNYEDTLSANTIIIKSLKSDRDILQTRADRLDKELSNRDTGSASLDTWSILLATTVGILSAVVYTLISG